MPQTEHLISTIIPVFNRPVLIREAVDSVLGQTYRPIEIIIVDDGSTDTTPGVIANLQSEYPQTIKVCRIENSGPGMAREAGRALAMGEYIQYLDSDDILYPKKFATQVQLLKQFPDTDACYCTTLYRAGDKLSHQSHGKRTHESISTMWPSFMANRWWSTLTPLHRTTACDAVGPWSDLMQEEDWEYEIRLALAGGKLCHADQPLCEVRHHVGERISGGTATEQLRMRNRVRARELIFQHVERAGADLDCPESREFARAAFLLARQCGALGMVEESKQMFVLSRKASGVPGSAEYRLYKLMAGLMGWTMAGKLSQWRDYFGGNR